ncbi:sperm-associated microtubule inner protein 4-like isoform X1 [Eleginops maclovinus]
MWTGEHGFLDHSKPLKGESQVFYPTSPKSVLPNPKMRTFDLTITERTNNMLRDLERTHWVTTYQMHHTGSGPANPLKIDDFQEKIYDITRMNSHNAPLRETSFPVFVPSKPRGGCKRREAGTWSTAAAAAAAEHTNVSSAKNHGTGRPQVITAKYNEATDPDQKGHYQSKYSSGSTEAWRAEPSQEVSPEQQNERKCSLYKGKERDNYMSRETSEQEILAEGRELLCSLPNPCILPRPPVLPGIHQVDRALCLMDLQNSFSKTKAQHNFNRSVTHAAVNLRDNVHTGKKHDFYGINCYYLHG